MDSSRLFLAIPFPPGVREPVRRTLPDRLPGRLVPPRNWHLTLRFLGQVARPRQESIARVLRNADLGKSRSLRLTRLGGFPDLGRARVLWLWPDKGDVEGVAGVAAAVDAALAAAGEPSRNRPFHPHLTLSRLRPPRDLQALARGFRSGVNLPVAEVVLFRSVPGGDAPRYERVESFNLDSEP